LGKKFQKTVGVDFLTHTVDNCKSLTQHQLDRRIHYGPIFIRLAVVASPNRDVTRNSDKIWP